LGRVGAPGWAGRAYQMQIPHESLVDP